MNSPNLSLTRTYVIPGVNLTTIQGVIPGVNLKASRIFLLRHLRHVTIERLPARVTEKLKTMASTIELTIIFVVIIGIALVSYFVYYTYSIRQSLEGLTIARGLNGSYSTLTSTGAKLSCPSGMNISFIPSTLQPYPLYVGTYDSSCPGYSNTGVLNQSNVLDLTSDVSTACKGVNSCTYIPSSSAPTWTKSSDNGDGTTAFACSESSSSAAPLFYTGTYYCS